MDGRVMSIDTMPLDDLIRTYLDRQDTEGLRALLANQFAPDIADALDRLDDDQREVVFELLSPDLAADVLPEASTDTARDLLEDLTPEEAGALLDRMPMDEVAEILGEDVPDRSQALLAQMSPDDAEDVRSLLHYPRNSAGRLMTDKFVSVDASMKAGDIIEHMCKVDRDAETFTDVYVIEPDLKLIGVASLREIILAPSRQPVREFMTTHIIAVAPTDDQEFAARQLAHYNFLAMPVVDEAGRILGIITVDDIIDILIQEQTEDQLRLGAVEPGAVNQPYFTTPILQVVRSRVVWLLLLFVGGTFTGEVLRIFDDELSKVVALSFFIPLLIGTGGNTGAQTVSTIIRGIALKEVQLRDTFAVLRRELSSGLLLGVVLGIIGFGRAMLWSSGVELSLVVALTLVAVCTWANIIAGIIPLIVYRFKIDPALVSAPLITTLVDATGLAIYLLIAKALLSSLR